MPETAALVNWATTAELSPNCPASSWLTRTRSLRIGSIQLKFTFCTSGLAPMIAASLSAVSRTLYGSGPLPPVCARPPTTGPQFERGNPPDRLGELFLKRGVQAFLDSLPRLQALGNDDRFRKEIVLELHVERQIESNPPGAPLGTPADDIGVATEDFVELLRGRIRCIDRGVVPQAQINHELRPVRCGKELAGAKPREPERDAENHDSYGQRYFGVAHGEKQAAAVET